MEATVKSDGIHAKGGNGAVPPADPLEAKQEALRSRIQGFGRVLIAFSGGVDSGFLLKTARDVLGRECVLALTALSDTVPEHDREEAAKLAASLEVEHLVLSTRHMDIEAFVRNDQDRCYVCKTEVYTTCGRVAAERGIAAILDGTNLDDLGDVRPGLKAAREFGIHSPLADAGLTKQDIRELSRRSGLAIWDRPASPCLSSRFPRGMRITVDGLSRVDRSEAYLRSLGFAECRVRAHGDVARIEVPGADFARLSSPEIRAGVARRLREEGFKFVCVDLEEFRSGRLSST